MYSRVEKGIFHRNKKDILVGYLYLICKIGEDLSKMKKDFNIQITNLKKKYINIQIKYPDI